MGELSLTLTIEVGDAAVRMQMADFEPAMLHPDRRDEMRLMVDELLDQMAAKLGVYDRLAETKAQYRALTGNG